MPGLPEKRDIVKVAYKPVVDINGNPVVRKITAEDLDEIGVAVAYINGLGL